MIVREEGKLKEAVMYDFGSAYTEKEIHDNPALIYELELTPSSTSDLYTKNFVKAKYEVEDTQTYANPAALKKNQQAADKAIQAAEKAMAFSFGMMLFDIYTREDFEVTKPSYAYTREADNKTITYVPAFVVEQVIDGKATTVPAEMHSGAARLAKDESLGDLTTPRFNEEAIQHLDADIQILIKGLMHPDPSKQMSFEEARKRFKAYEKRTAPK